LQGKPEYLVHWEGHDDSSEYTWEPTANLQNVKDMWKNYDRSLEGLPPLPTKEEKEKAKKKAKKDATASKNKPTPKATVAQEPKPKKVLPEGWKTETRTGSKAGKSFQIYISPDGHTLRSYPDVERFISGDYKPRPSKPKAASTTTTGAKPKKGATETVSDHPDQERDFRYQAQKVNDAATAMLPLPPEDDLCFVCR